MSQALLTGSCILRQHIRTHLAARTVRYCTRTMVRNTLTAMCCLLKLCVEASVAKHRVKVYVLLFDVGDGIYGQ